MHLSINLHKLVSYANSITGTAGTLETLEVSKLTGGYISDGVYRHNLVFRLADGNTRVVSVVQKYTNQAEVRVMEALREVPNAEAIPLIIDSSMDVPIPDATTANWFVTPFYEGRALTFADETPASIIRTLAWVHAHFTSRLKQFEELEGLYRVDASFFRRTFTNAMESLEQLELRSSQNIGAELYSHFNAIGESGIFEETLGTLPVTVVHGDVHPGNMIQGEKSAVLIDWGNARIAPAMLDIANVIKIDSPNWATYLSTYAEAAGTPLDPMLARQSYYWAVAMVNLQYLPFASSHLPAKVPGMMEQVIEARDQLLTSRRSNHVHQTA
jgi:aminoglycoside phosphotransferase (APT) family kinase protein